MLTKRQRDALVFLEAYQRESGGVSPSFAEITKALGVTSKCSPYGLLNSLEERGYIRRLRFRHSAIEILRSADGKRQPGKIPVFRSGDHKLMGYLP